MKDLNIRQKAFCEYYVASGNATDSAIKAGYDEKYIRTNIPKLLKKTTILKYIKNLREKTKSKRIMDAVKRREWLTNILNSEEVKMSDKLKALDILNKMDGEYTEKVQINNELYNPFENISNEDIKKLIENGG